MKLVELINGVQVRTETNKKKLSRWITNSACRNTVCVYNKLRITVGSLTLSKSVILVGWGIVKYSHHSQSKITTWSQISNL